MKGKKKARTDDNQKRCRYACKGETAMRNEN